MTRHGSRKEAEITEGSPYPLGATWDGLDVNFALFSAHATAVDLCLFEESGERELERIGLPSHTDEVWHGYLPHPGPWTVYGYCVHGPYDPEGGAQPIGGHDLGAGRSGGNGMHHGFDGHQGFDGHHGFDRGEHRRFGFGPVFPYYGYFPPYYTYETPGYRYYRPSYGAYYPSVATCPEAWVPVPDS